MKIETLRELFVDELQDMHSAEQQITKALPKIVKASHDPNLRQALEHHLEETKNHVMRLEQVLKSMHENPKGKTCEGMKGLLKEGEDRISAGKPGEVLDAGIISAAQRVEHYEIAAYGSARTYAELLGNQEAVRLLSETLQEEKNADAKLNEIARKVNVEAKAA
jgi:ferritin-like metal-binding protein YciE